MRILVVGATGMLGHKLCQVLHGAGHEVVGTCRRLDFPAPAFKGVKLVRGVDVLDARALADALRDARPEAIVNAAGVVKQSRVAKDAVTMLEVNAVLPHRLAALAEGARLIQVSTDCVFSGERGGYEESDVPDARDLYGRSKLLGELGEPALTIRTSIVGRALRGTDGLVEWFLSERGRTVRGYVNARFSGLTTAALARTIETVLARHPDLKGLYHVAAEPISKHDLLGAIERRLRHGTRIEPHETFRCDRTLDGARFRRETGWTPPSWDDMLDDLARECADYDRWRAGC